MASSPSVCEIEEFTALMVHRHLFGGAAAFITGWRGRGAAGQLSRHYPVMGDSPEHVYPYDRSYVSPIREW